MARYYLTGGRQRVSRFVRRDEWTAFEKAVLLELDTESGQTRVVLEYEGDPAHVPVLDPSHIFKAAAWDGDRVLLCTQTEVLVFDPSAERIVEVISHPCFNDVHHVTRLAGRIHVVCTGLDAVAVLDDAGAIAELHSVTGSGVWERFDESIDYRRVATTKPHAAHPNYVFEAAGRIWVGRFEQGDAWPLDGDGDPFPVSEDPIHDGVPSGDEVWFTRVSGGLIGVDARSGETTSHVDLNAFSTDPGVPLGWCRGLAIEDDRMLVGFSRLRPTLFKQNLGWLRGALKRPEPEPTRVCAYDIEGGRLLQTWPIEQAGISAVFSILPAEPR